MISPNKCRCGHDVLNHYSRTNTYVRLDDDCKCSLCGCLCFNHWFSSDVTHNAVMMAIELRNKKHAYFNKHFNKRVSNGL